jgi:hypothetical protein
MDIRVERKKEYKKRGNVFPLAGLVPSSELASQCIGHGNQYPVGIESPIFVFAGQFAWLLHQQLPLSPLLDVMTTE